MDIFRYVKTFVEKFPVKNNSKIESYLRLSHCSQDTTEFNIPNLL